jgi:excisionase family DNA binding protein
MYYNIYTIIFDDVSHTSFPVLLRLVAQTNRRQAMSDLLTVSEVARILRVDDATVRRWVKQGVLEAVVLPHVHSRQVYRIKRETLNRVLGDSSLLQ